MSKGIIEMSMDKETSKVTVTLSDETIEWLESEYSDALSTQEAMRSALSDARIHRCVVTQYQEMPSRD